MNRIEYYRIVCSAIFLSCLLVSCQGSTGSSSNVSNTEAITPQQNNNQSNNQNQQNAQTDPSETNIDLDFVLPEDPEVTMEESDVKEVVDFIVSNISASGEDELSLTGIFSIFKRKKTAPAPTVVNKPKPAVKKPNNVEDFSDPGNVREIYDFPTTRTNTQKRAVAPTNFRAQDITTIEGRVVRVSPSRTNENLVADFSAYGQPPVVITPKVLRDWSAPNPGREKFVVLKEREGSDLYQRFVSTAQNNASPITFPRGGKGIPTDVQTFRGADGSNYTFARFFGVE